HQFRVKTFFDDDGEDDGTVHTVSITSFDNNKFVNRNNRNLYSVSGVCSTIGGGILVTATRDGNSVTKSEVCGSDQTWSAGLNLATLNDGVLSINVKHSLGGSIGEANDSVTKDTLPPSVALTSPNANTGIRALNASNFNVSGSCSENNQLITVQGVSDTGGTPNVTTQCFGSHWSTTLDVSSLADGSVRVLVHHQDNAGNRSSNERNYFKDTVLPEVTITNPENSSIVNSQNFNNLNFNGTCSENGSRIALSGDISTTIAVTCLNGHWSAPGGTITGADGPKIVTATVTDPAGNVSYTSVGILKYTTAPTAVITNTPQINDQQLDIRIEGVGVTHYRYKIGDDE